MNPTIQTYSEEVNTVHKVFLVDDDHFVRKGLLRLIDWEGCGFTVCAEADNGEDALEMIEKIAPDLVVTDIQMPVPDGLNLIKSVVESTNIRTNFINISGYNDFKYAQQAMRYGVYDFILKPIDKEEFEKTLVKVSEKIREENMLRKNREKLVTLVTLEEILQGEANKENELAYREKLNIEIGQKIRYIIVEMNNVSYDVSNLTDIVDDAISSCVQDDTLIIHEHGNNSCGLLMTDKQLQPYENDMARFSRELQDQISLNLNTEISLFIGKKVTQLYEIQESYKTAITVSQFKYIIEKNNPIEYERFKDKSVNYIELEHSFYGLLVERIEENDTEAILHMIDEMFQNFKTKMFARDAVKTSINRCVHDLIKTIKNLDGNENNLSTLDQMLHWDYYPLTLTKIQDVFTAFVLESAELIVSLHSDNAKGIIHQGRKYIERHVDENITLKDIANEFYMNSVYLGQLFKKTYGIYFKDFIWQVRINEAKKILRQTDKRVYQVGESVGIGNADYFVTQFEKIVGMTPTQYRNKIFGKTI